MIINGALYPPPSEEEQRRIQGAAFVKASGAPFAEDKTERNWHKDAGRKLPEYQDAAKPGDTRTLSDIEQARLHGLSVLENSK